MARFIFRCLGACLLEVNIIVLMSTHCVDCQPAEFWNNQGKDTLKKALNLQRLNLNIAQNIVLFVGDGMDIATSNAARIRKGQLAGNTGEEASLEWENFSHIALSKTYNTDLQVGDSAGTATAILCGIKTKFGTLAVDDRVEFGNCSSAEDAEVDSVMKLAQNAGKATGFVTTTRVTHATPAALYAHTPSRRWEYTVPLEESEEGCKDIALQMIENGQDINVIMGGGRRNFLPNTTADPEYDDEYGKRIDGRNLIDEWLSLRPKSDRRRYVWNLEDFNMIEEKKVDHLLGLFETSHMQYESARMTDDKAGEPSLSQMTEKAIKILQKNKNGFFLLVEGGRIDHGHHKGVAYDAIEDTLAMEKAVATTIKLTNEEDTLVIVTADHGHVMTISGYPSRGNPILGLHDSFDGTDDLPYTTLSYANGPGANGLNESFHATGTRLNLTDVDTEDADFVQPSLVPLSYETHGGQDVAIHARGPMAHLFHGVHEQNYIAHVMMYAACLGEYQDHCEVKYQEQVICGAPSSVRMQTTVLTFVIASLCRFIFIY